MTDQRPNVLLFMTDQQRADTLGCLGSQWAHTPAFDKLAARGTLFGNAFSQHSACSQSRASIMTGWYPHTAGHRSLDNLLKPWEPNLLRLFKSHGYYVAWAGARGDLFAPGVTEESADFAGYLTQPGPGWFASYSRPHPLDTDLDRLYVDQTFEPDGPTPDEATIATSIQLLQESMPEPWLLFVALADPHPPYATRERWRSLHDPRSMPERVGAPRASGFNTPGKPAFMAHLRRRYEWDKVSEEAWCEAAAMYHGMVSSVDEGFGHVMSLVDSADRATVVATFTDHGDYMGDFGLIEKWPSGVDECLLRNPFILMVPDGIGGLQSSALVEMIDLLPTLAEYAEIEVGHQHFGRSLGPLVRGETSRHRDLVFSDGGFRLSELPLFEQVGEGEWYAPKARLQHERPELVGACSVVRSETWTYVHRLYEHDELYHRADDPHETTNVIAESRHRATLEMLRGAMLDWYADTSAVLPAERDPRFTVSLLREPIESLRRHRG
jgi:arylsulfatase A-like enzyme